MISVLTRDHWVYYSLPGRREEMQKSSAVMSGQIPVMTAVLVTGSLCLRGKGKAVPRSESDAMLAQTKEQRRERL